MCVICTQRKREKSTKIAYTDRIQHILVWKTRHVSAMNPYRNIADPHRFAPSTSSTPVFTIFVGLTAWVVLLSTPFPQNSDEDENDGLCWCFCFEL